MKRFFVALLLSVCVSVPTQAQVSSPAAESDESAESQARVHFEAGIRALQEDRFHDAARELSRSHGLLPNVANTFNLAVAFLRIARARDAIRLFRELEGEAFGPIEAAQREAIGARIEEAQRALGTLEVSVDGEVVAQVSVDDVDAGPVRPGESLRLVVDPGSRRVEATSVGGGSASTTVTAESGEALRVELNLTAPLLEPSPSPPRANYRRRRVLWASVAILVVGGAALALGLALRNRVADPITDPVTGIGETLRSTTGISF